MAKEIDFLKLYNNIDSRAYRLFSNPSTYLSFLGIGGCVAFQSLTAGEWYSLLVTLPILIASWDNLYKKILPIDKEKYLLEKIRQTSEYKECLSLYDDYITKIAELLQSLHLHNIFDTCNLINTLLKAGEFSHNSKYDYHSYKNDLFPIIELSGVRVLSGCGVCRHEATFTTNILNRMGHRSSVIVVRKVENLADRLEKLFPEALYKPIWNHAIVGIQENGEKILFDSTAGKFAGCIPNLNEFPKLVALLYSEFIEKYVIIEPNQTTFTGLYNINMDEFMDLPLTELNPKEIEKSSYDTANIFRDNIKLFAKFQEENNEQVERIAKLEKKIVPYSDDEIVSWKIK